MPSRATVPRSLLPVVLVATFCTIFFIAPPAPAGEHSGVTMADSVDVAGTKLQLNGMALRKVAFFKVYVAGLYLPSMQTEAEAILGADTHRRMVMHWLRGADRDRICDAWMEGLEANTPSPSAELEQQFEQLCGWTDGAEDGVRFVFTYVPGEGTEVEVDGKSRGSVAGKAFADALLATWIGPEPGPGEAFKEDLLDG